MILLIHSLFGHRSISLLDLLKIGSFLDKPIDLDFCRNMANDYGWGKTFDLSAAKIEYLCNSIKLPYERSHLSFPYLLDAKIYYSMYYEIENLNISKGRQLFLNLS